MTKQTSGPHLVASISGHGFGHVAQTAPVLNAMYHLMPQLRITVRSTAPLAHLRSRINVPFDYLASDGDIGMVMSSALDVHIEKSRAAYLAFHHEWDARIMEETNLLQKLGADMVLSNVGYLPLAGAHRANIPNAALCSLNWHDIYRHYCGEDDISRQILSCYAATDIFLRATPGMPMDYLSNLVPIGPIAEIGTNRRDELSHYLQLQEEEKLVLVSMGGIASRLPMERWPLIKRVRWLVQANWQIEHPQAIAFDSLGMSFCDVLASCDALITKPGYGSFVEAACSGIPVLFVGRADWPEASALVKWLQMHGKCIEVARDVLESGAISRDLEYLWQDPKPVPFSANGAGQAAALLLDRLTNKVDQWT